jgi:hypothetical protein
MPDAAVHSAAASSPLVDGNRATASQGLGWLRALARRRRYKWPMHCSPLAWPFTGASPSFRRAAGPSRPSVAVGGAGHGQTASVPFIQTCCHSTGLGVSMSTRQPGIGAGVGRTAALRPAGTPPPPFRRAGRERALCLCGRRRTGVYVDMEARERLRSPCGGWKTTARGVRRAARLPLQSIHRPRRDGLGT